jgi:hypothetical protein
LRKEEGKGGRLEEWKSGKILWDRRFGNWEREAGLKS